MSSERPMKLPATDRATLTKQHVLLAVAKAIVPRSLYIANEVHAMHREYASAGRERYPRVSLILSRLRSLEKDGLLECVGGPDGYYGFEWRITDAGRAALSLGEQP